MLVQRVRVRLDWLGTGMCNTIYGIPQFFGFIE